MAYSFTKIEVEKSRIIHAAFLFLIGLYFGGMWVILLLFKNFFFIMAILSRLAGESGRGDFRWPDVSEVGTIFVFALALAVIHWIVTTYGLVDRLLKIFRITEPDPNDSYQKTFQNVVEEVCVATGGSQIRAMVIPTSMLNACSFADGKSIPVIAVSKGLLYKLNRAQLEAVVAHEGAHVVSRDCESTTIISAMFGMFSAVLSSLEMMGAGYFDVDSTKDNAGDRLVGGTLSNSRSGPIILFVFIVIAVLWIINTLGVLMRMFISRQREYRADAVAVRLTRSPQALAEALYIIANRRHFIYQSADALESLFIVSPAYFSLDEELGFLSDLFSTHPPIGERIRILQEMAHINVEPLQQALKTISQTEDRALAVRQSLIGEAKGGSWFVKTLDGSWTGPHPINVLAMFEWLTPGTLIKRMSESTVIPIAQLQQYLKVHPEPLPIPESIDLCPSCGNTLKRELYERIKVLHCQFCEGYLVHENDVGVILARKEAVFDERIQKMAQAVLAERPVAYSDLLASCDSQRNSCCDNCRNNPRRMRRKLFNRYYPLEVDKCGACGLTWFDKDELQVMQCMYEIRNSDVTLGH